MNLTRPGSRTVKPVICCAKTAQQIKRGRFPLIKRGRFPLIWRLEIKGDGGIKF